MVYVVVRWSNVLGAMKSVASVHEKESNALKAVEEYRKNEYLNLETETYVVLKRPLDD